MGAYYRKGDRRILGFRGFVARYTPANANEQRYWRIYADVAQVLIREARAVLVAIPVGALFALRRKALSAFTSRFLLR